MSKNSQVVAALEAFRKHGTLTPTELTKAIDVDACYASKFVCYLRFYGYEISAVKDGRTVVSYTFVGETNNMKPMPGGKAKALSTKTSQAKVVKATKPEKSEKKVKGKPIMTKAEIKKAAKAIQEMRKPKDEVESTFGSSGAISASYSVDADWDSTEGLDLRSLGI